MERGVGSYWEVCEGGEKAREDGTGEVGGV